VKRFRFSSLWMAFAAITFFVLIATACLVVTVAFTMYQLGFWDTAHGNPNSPIAILLLLSTVIGGVLFLFVGKIFLRPIEQLNEAAKQVATGNFEAKITTHSRIMEINNMSASFNRMVQELASIETLRSDFIANVSHELKTPLAAIEGFATLLQDQTLSDADRDEYVHMIIGSARQLSALTENILNLSKLENQEIVIDKATFRLDEQIREAILLLENKWSEKNLDLAIELETVSYYGGESLLRQIWLNLLDNAIKFTQKNGKIEIDLRVHNKKAAVTIKDSGRGINPAEMKHIFDKFYQADTARKASGYGLGLALVKRIADLCEVTVSVQSPPGEGSTFIVELPILNPPM